MRIEGRAAVVTGGASGLGLATARMLSQAGARVALVGSRATAEGARLVPGSAEDTMATVRIRHKKPEGATATEAAFPMLRKDFRGKLSDAPRDLQFAAAVVAFAEIFLSKAPSEWKRKPRLICHRQRENLAPSRSRQTRRKARRPRSAPSRCRPTPLRCAWSGSAPPSKAG